MRGLVLDVFTLRPIRDFGTGAIAPDEIDATRDDPLNPLALPPKEVLVLYRFLTAEAMRGARVEVRLWYREGDAGRYLEGKASGDFRGTLYEIRLPKPGTDFPLS